MLFGHKGAMWVRPAELLPFRRYLAEKESAGAAACEGGSRLASPTAFRAAVQVHSVPREPTLGRSTASRHVGSRSLSGPVCLGLLLMPMEA